MYHTLVNILLILKKRCVCTKELVSNHLCLSKVLNAVAVKGGELIKGGMVIGGSAGQFPQDGNFGQNVSFFEKSRAFV